MKRLFLSAFLSLYLFSLQAQSYKLFHSSSDYFYSEATGFSSPIDFAIHIDSSWVNGADTFYVNYPVNQKQELGAPCFYSFKDTTWLGPVVIERPGGEWNLFNYLGDTIRILTQANLNDTWTFLDIGGGNSIKATVDSITIGSVLGMTQNLKSIVLEAINNGTGNAIPHWINGFSLKISEDLGLTLAQDFFSLPINTYIYDFNLAGMTNPDLGFQNFGATEIFDFDVNDTIQMHNVNRDGFTYDYEGWEQWVFLTGNISGSPDTLRYVFEWKWVSLDLMNGGQAIAWDTTELVIPLQDNLYKRLGNYPYESRDPDLSMLGDPWLPNIDAVSAIGSLPMKQEMAYTFSFDVTDQCFHELLLTWYIPDLYFRGLGGHYWDYIDTYARRKHMPSYYHKGNDVWGIPVDLDPYLSNAEIKLNTPSFTLSPNPLETESEIVVNAGNENSVSIKVIDLSGRIILEREYKGGRMKLNRQDFSSAGIYLIRLETPSGIFTVKKIIVN